MPTLIKVNYKVAKALKDAGYPQEVVSQCEESTDVLLSDDPGTYLSYAFAKKNGYLDTQYLIKNNVEYCVCPSFLEAWVWLSVEKGIGIDALHVKTINGEVAWRNGNILDLIPPFYGSPEELIMCEIRDMVDKGLIK